MARWVIRVLIWPLRGPTDSRHRRSVDPLTPISAARSRVTPVFPRPAFIVLMEGGQCMGYPARRWPRTSAIRRNSPFGSLRSGNRQRHNFQPETVLMQQPDGVQDVLSTLRARGRLVVQAFQIDLVQIDPGAQVIEHLWCALCWKCTHVRPCVFACLNTSSPLAGDQGLVIGAGNDGCPQMRGLLRQPFGLPPSSAAPGQSGDHTRLVRSQSFGNRAQWRSQPSSLARNSAPRGRQRV